MNQSNIQVYAEQQKKMAFARANALSEIENLTAFNLDAEAMRKEIARVIAECKAEITGDSA